MLPIVLGPHDAAAVKASPEIAGKNVEGGCIIAPGGGDNAMASLGLGMSVGDVSVSLGTSGVAAAISENPTYDLTGAVSGFADCTGHYLPLACTINGSRILDAGRAALGVDYEELAQLAFASEPGAGGITLVPYFDGERTPNRPDATATLSGMTLANTTRENLARASSKDCCAPSATAWSSSDPWAQASRAFCSSAAARSPKLSARWHQAFWAWT